MFNLKLIKEDSPNDFNLAPIDQARENYRQMIQAESPDFANHSVDSPDKSVSEKAVRFATAW